MEMKLVELPHEERKTLVVHRQLAEHVKRARKPGEHIWQTTHRLLVTGLQVQLQEEKAIAS